MLLVRRVITRNMLDVVAVSRFSSASKAPATSWKRLSLEEGCQMP